MRQNCTEIIEVFTIRLIELMLADNKTVSKKLELNPETYPSTQVTIYTKILSHSQMANGKLEGNLL